MRTNLLFRRSALFAIDPPYPSFLVFHKLSLFVPPEKKSGLEADQNELKHAKKE